MRVDLLARAAALGLAAGLVTGCGVGTPSKRENVDYTIDEPVTSVRVRADAGAVEIVAGPALRVTERLRYNRDRPRTTRAVRDGRLHLEDHGCGNVIGYNVCDVGYRVVVPAALAVSVTTDGGAITVRGVSGATDAHSDAGAIRIEGGGAPRVSAHSDGGRIEVTGLAGELEATSDAGAITVAGTSTRRVVARTGGGAITITGVAGPVQARTDAGRVRLDVASREVTAHTDGGAVDLRLRAVPDRVGATTDAGAVTVRVPRAAYLVDARTDAGRTTVGVPTDPASPHRITVATDGGDIAVVLA